MWPSMTIPPPIPVPTVSITRWRTSTFASGPWASATAATVASLSTNTGRFSRLRRIWRSGTFSSGMLTEDRAIPLAQSTTLGMPMPTASAGSCSSMASVSCSTSASADSSSVGRTRASPSVPSSSAATATFVPPTSTPINRVILPADCHTPMDEAALLQRLRARDETAFAELVRMWSPSMLRLARMYVATQAVAEEVVQEAWLGVLQGIDRFEGRSSLKTWVFRILVNRAMTKGVREARSLPFATLATNEASADEPAVDPDRFTRDGAWASPPRRWEDQPEAALRSAETLEVVRAAIAQLPPTQKAVITMRDLDGFDAEDTRNALEISESNQRVLLHRARAKVRAALEKHFGEADEAVLA